MASILIGCDVGDDITSITCQTGNGLPLNDTVGYQLARFDLTKNVVSAEVGEGIVKHIQLRACSVGGSLYYSGT